jgi:nucleotidyltransferase/DNA polymerase involved in DNA repair
VASVGVAPNKFLAKIASDLKKPDALVVVAPDKVQEFLDPLLVERLWGVGEQSSKVFQRLGNLPRRGRHLLMISGVPRLLTLPAGLLTTTV